jgi:hypothetical protein
MNLSQAEIRTSHPPKTSPIRLHCVALRAWQIHPLGILVPRSGEQAWYLSCIDNTEQCRELKSAVLSAGKRTRSVVSGFCGPPARYFTVERLGERAINLSSANRVAPTVYTRYQNARVCSGDRFYVCSVSMGPDTKHLLIIRKRNILKIIGNQIKVELRFAALCVASCCVVYVKRLFHPPEE